MNSTKSSGYFAPLVLLQEVITQPGNYVTRCGETVKVETASRKHQFACHGSYPNGISESWHRSGRILASRETDNDIVSKIFN
jgi:hypothetical protein